MHLPNSQSENAIKQLKTLTSPLSKFAANIGSALDPRKYGSKVRIDYFFGLNAIFISNNVFHLLQIFNFIRQTNTQFYSQAEYSFLFILFSPPFKTTVNEPVPDLEKEKLQEKWEASKCKTKLIAL